uniref:cell division protein n=1 Tax=Tetraselmis suecica TaxID=270643 RepID=UPI0021D53390|nr:cell division protein [Tetraselmis suecica]UXF58512.1 cell division protein [Tetraselmis suecica]
MFFLSKSTIQSWEIFLFKLNIILIESKRFTKDFFVNPINLPVLPKTVFLAIPILFYFSCLGESKRQELNDFFDKTLPGLAKQRNKVSWETFQKTNYFPILPTSSTLSLISPVGKNLNWKKIENYPQLVYETTLLNLETWSQFLTIKFNDTWKSYKKQFFLGIKLYSNGLNNQKKFIYPARENVSSPTYQNIYINQKPHVNSLPFYHLDEYPLKVENIYIQKNFLVLPIDIKKEFQKDLPLISKETIFIKKTIKNKLIFSGVKKKSDLVEVTEKIQSNFYKINADLFDPLLVKQNFQLKWKKLTTRIKQLQSQTNYNLSPNLFVFAPTHLTVPVAVKNKFEILASHQILELIKNSNQSSKSNHSSLIKIQLNRLPLMSGFLYPDSPKGSIFEYNSTITTLFKVFFHQNISKFHKEVKIYLGPHFVWPELYFQKQKNRTPLTFQYHPVSFKARNGKILYKGPGILFPDTYETNFSVYTNYLLENQKNLKVLLDQPDPRQIRPFYTVSKMLNGLEPKTVFIDSVNNLYQIAHKTNYLDPYLQLNCSSEKRHHKYLAPLLGFQPQYIVPYFDSDNWRTWASQNILVGKRQKALTHSFPLRLSQQMTNPNLKMIYDCIDYQNPNWVLKSIKIDILNFTDLQIQSCNPKLVEMGEHKNVIYQHQASIYIAKQNELTQTQKFLNKILKFLQLETETARTLWEPLHQTSWLIVNKFLLAILVVYILQHFSREYGKELVAYLLDLFASVGIVDDSLKEEVAPQTIKKTYRVIKNSKKNFQSIASINHIFSDIAEIVWFLRNSGRPFPVGNLVAKGVLLVGSPGTGKTLLVQAIAGEAEVPVLVQAASTLQSLEGRGPQKLQILFEKARKLGSCIIFFDELDSIGEKRSQIIQNPIGEANILSLLYQNIQHQTKQFQYGVPFPKTVLNPLNEKKVTNLENKGIGENKSNTQEQGPEQLGLLMQLLIELDGLQINQRLIVIGATNRPEVLDPALIRPGRLSKILEIGLPNRLNRVTICQLYSHSLGASKTICWNTIAEQTIGLSGADLATIMNQSTIQAILLGTKHTQKSIHLAIDKIIGCGRKTYDSVNYINKLILTESTKLKHDNLEQHFIVCSAYNEAGFKLLEYFLPHHKNPTTAKLISTTKSARYKKQDLDFFIKKNQLTAQYKLQFRTKIITNLSGKAAELLFLNRSKLIKWNQLSTLLDFNSNQLKTASNLIFFIISKEAFFPRYSSFFNFSLGKNQNQIEYMDMEVISLFNNLASKYEKDLLSTEFSKYRRFQRWTTKPWWQLQVSKLESLRNWKKPSWYRLFVTHPDNSAPSDERLAPDIYFHDNNPYFIIRNLLFNDQYQNYRDRLYMTMLNTSFQLATSVLQVNRNSLDFFVVLLLQKHILTESELKIIFSNFEKNLNVANLTYNRPKIDLVTRKKNYAWQVISTSINIFG